MRRPLTALLGATLLLGACGDDDAGGSAAVTSLPDQTSSTTSTTATTEPPTVAPDVIPRDESQITEEYVEQVLNELYKVSLESILAAKQEGLVTEVSLNLVAAMTSDAVYEMRVNDLLELSSTGFEGLNEPPSPITASVTDVLQSSGDCVVAEIVTNASGLLTSPPSPDPAQRTFVRLLAAQAADLETGLNPTAWVLDQFPVTFDGSVPVDCESP